MLKNDTYLDDILQILKDVADTEPDFVLSDHILEEEAFDPNWDGSDQIVLNSLERTAIGSQTGVAGFRCPFIVYCVSMSKEKAVEMMSKVNVAFCAKLPIDTWMLTSTQTDRLINAGFSTDKGWLVSNQFVIFTTQGK
jgi:hypothetical protein